MDKDSDSDIICCRFVVRGLVQGVGYRYFVLRKAHILNINGYAKNQYDGSVEVVAEGKRYDVEQLHKFLEQGPSRANVGYCLYEEFEPKGQLDDFYIY